MMEGYTNKEFYYENQGSNTYLVYKFRPEDEIDTMSLGMLTTNDIPGLAAALYTQMDTNRYVKYNVTAKVSVTQLFSGPVNKKRLVGVLTGIADAMLSAEEYMLSASTILLDLDYIFADVSTCETELLCVPIMSNAPAKNLSYFFKDLIFRTQFDQTENCDHVAQILNYLNSVPNLSLTDFKEVLRGISNTAPAAPAQPVRSQIPVIGQNPQPVQPKPQPVQPQPQPVQPKPQPVQPKPQPVSQPAQQRYMGGMNIPNAPLGGMNIPNAPQGGMNIPGGAGAKPQPQPQPDDGPEISWWYLMQHYNKENAALYKAQQERKKAQSGSAKQPKAPKASKKAPPAPQGGQQAAWAQPQGGMNIPGGNRGGMNMPAAPQGGMNIPGAPQGGMNIPNGQQHFGGYPNMPAQQPAKPQPVSQPAPQPAPQPQPQFSHIDFGATVVMNRNLDATIERSDLFKPAQSQAYLLRLKNNEKIPLNRDVFRIGREKSYVDYHISDNPSVSKSHANIIRRGNDYVVVDTNSRNRTYVNDREISSNTETKLSHGTVLRFSDEEFEFKLY